MSAQTPAPPEFPSYVVMISIHGPRRSWDVVHARTATAVAVCFDRVIAQRVARLLSEHAGCDVEPAPVARRTR